jgi:hydroxymethylbilane synthase
LIPYSNDIIPAPPLPPPTYWGALKKTFSVVCRGSWLSLAQAEIFKAKVRQHDPEMIINVIIRNTAGDKNQSTPLHLVEGQDFFTKDIQKSLQQGEADFALHSMKDVSSADFFDNSCHAIIARDALQDVAVFNDDVLDKIKQDQTIRLGTSSPRRSVMAVDFLQKALPQVNGRSATLSATPVRGNVDVRLQKLSDGEYDGLVLAVAGLNRLLAYEPARDYLQQLLAHKKLMVLPLFDCPPAAGQGAIVAETAPGNTAAVALLNAIENKTLTASVQQERNIAHRHGYGCSQPFGAFCLAGPYGRFAYAHGQHQQQPPFTEWHFEAPIAEGQYQILNTAQYMKHFFTYEYVTNTIINPSAKAAFISSHKAVHSSSLIQSLHAKNIWAAGTKTWFALAKQGLWVNGCADGLGLSFLWPLLQSPLFGLTHDSLEIITNQHSAARWQQEGWNALGTYLLHATHQPALIEALQKAAAIFWTSFQQYEAYHQYVQPSAIHCCPSGKTAALLQQQGVEPKVFPTIKAFSQWNR